MTCPECETQTRVIDSRTTTGEEIRRRRLCPKCTHRFTTYEIPEESLNQFAFVRLARKPGGGWETTMVTLTEGDGTVPPGARK